MSKICKANLYAIFQDASRDDINQIIDDVSSIAKVYSRDPQAANAMFKEFLSQSKAQSVFKNHILLQDLLAKSAVLDYVTHPSFGGDIGQAEQSLFMITRSNVEGSGSNIELQTMTRRQNYISNMHAYLANKGIFEQVRSGMYDKEVWIAIASGDMSKLSPTASDFAGILKHSTTMIHKDHVNSGLMVKYRPDYVVPRIYSQDKVDAIGLNGFAMKYMANIDLKKTFPDVPMEDMRKLYEHLKEGKDLKSLVINKYDPASDTSMTENLLAKEILEDYNKNTIYDKYTDSELSNLIVGHNTATGSSLGERKIKGRSLIFQSPEHEYNFWSDLTPYNSILEAYMGYAKRSAKDLSIIDKLGTKPESTIDLLKQINKKSMDMGEATTLNNKLDNWWISTKGFKQGEKSIANIIVNDYVVPATAMKLLGMAGLSNLRDVNTTYFHYLVKSNQDPMTAIAQTFGNYLSAYVESAKVGFGSSEKGLEYLLHHSESFLKEIEESTGSYRSLVSRAASLQNVISGTKFINRASHIANYKLYVKILKDAVQNPEGLSDTQIKLFNKYGLGVDDIKYLGDVMGQFKGPSALSNGMLLLPEEQFANNPKGMKPELYRDSMAKKLGNYLNDSIRTGAPIPGMREKLYTNFNQADPNNAYALAGKLLTNFKSILFKIFMDAHSTLGLAVNQESKSAIYQDPKAWAYALPLLIGGVSSYALVDMVKKLIKGHSVDDQMREIHKDPFHYTANALGRSDVFGFLGDFAVKANRPADVMAALGTPALDTLLLPGSIVYNMAEGTINKGKPFNKNTTARAVDLADKFIPFTNLIWLGGMTEEYNKQKKEFAKKLAR